MPQREWIGCMTSQPWVRSQPNFENTRPQDVFKPQVCGACVSYTSTVTTVTKSMANSKCVLNTSCHLQSDVLGMPTTKGWLGKEYVYWITNT